MVSLVTLTWLFPYYTFVFAVTSSFIFVDLSFCKVPAMLSNWIRKGGESNKIPIIPVAISNFSCRSIPFCVCVCVSDFNLIRRSTHLAAHFRRQLRKKNWSVKRFFYFFRLFFASGQEEARSRNVVDQVFAFDISRAQFVYLLLSRRLSSYPTIRLSVGSTVRLFSSSVVWLWNLICMFENH